MKFLPLISSTLLVATIILALTSRYLSSIYIRAGIFLGTFALCLLPLVTPLPLTHYVRVMTGDLSIVTTVVLMIFAAYYLRGMRPSRQVTEEFIEMCVIVLIGAFLLYPSALGATPFDIYAAGYYPVTLAPVLLTIFIVMIWREFFLLATLIALGFACHVLQILESDNLWDYLMDPVMVVFSVGYLLRHAGFVRKLKWSHYNLELGLSVFLATGLVFAAFLTYFNPEGLRYNFAPAAGYIETCTVLALIAVCLICLYRQIAPGGVHSMAFPGTNAVFFLTGLGAIAWVTGNNMDVELPAMLVESVFGIYLLVTIVSYRNLPRGREFLNGLGVPVAASRHIAGYLFVAFTSQLLIDAATRPEMTAFGLSFLFLLVVAFPANQECFSKQPAASQPVGEDFTPRQVEST